nr:unnamed protein product [Callosobruchus chinensis]
MSNYRPISLISNIAKIVEKVIKERLTSFFTKYDLIHANQFGFRQGKSTQDAIVAVTSKLYNLINKKTPAIGVFVDLAKAFDTVSHEKLLEVLECSGVRGTALKLLTSYLGNRTQRVRNAGILSSSKIIECGIPQGTVLGPILFILYINDLFNIGSSGTIVGFADDTVIIYEGMTWSSIKEGIQNDLRKVFTYFNSKLLTVNVEKTKFVPFASYKTHLPQYNTLHVHSNSKQINIGREDTIKYLGIHIDSNLRWNCQTEHVVKKIRILLPKMKNLAGILSERSLRTLYFGLIQSHLNYGIIAWGGASSIHLRSLVIMQKYIMKIIYKKPRTFPSDELFRFTKLLDIRQLYTQALLIYQHKHKEQIHKLHHNYSTRQVTNTQHVVPKPEKTLFQRSCVFLCPKIYNELPPTYRLFNSLSIFKHKIKDWLFHIPRSTLNEYIEGKNYYLPPIP